MSPRENSYQTAIYLVLIGFIKSLLCIRAFQYRSTTTSKSLSSIKVLVLNLDVGRSNYEYLHDSVLHDVSSNWQDVKNQVILTNMWLNLVSEIYCPAGHHPGNYHRSNYHFA